VGRRAIAEFGYFDTKAYLTPDAVVVSEALQPNAKHEAVYSEIENLALPRKLFGAALQLAPLRMTLPDSS
jgi:hypothetical protein